MLSLGRPQDRSWGLSSPEAWVRLELELWGRRGRGVRPSRTPWEQGSALAWQLKKLLPPAGLFLRPVHHSLLGTATEPILEVGLFLLSPSPTCPCSLAQAAERSGERFEEPWREGSGSADSQQEIHCRGLTFSERPEFLFGNKGLVLAPCTKKRRKERKMREIGLWVWRAVTRLL